jgi:hypothetical protein
MDYVNASTGQMLVAEPGGSYDIRATWYMLPVPPADGFWLVEDDASDYEDKDEGGDAEGEGSPEEEKEAAEPVTTAPEE